MHRIGIVLFLSILYLNAFSQDLSGFQKAHYVQGTDTLPYRILYPDNYDSKQSYPLLLFLHGAGDRGNDNVKQLSKGGALFTSNAFRAKHPAIVVFPQCSYFSFWTNTRFGYDTATKKILFKFPLDVPPTKSMEMVMALMQDLLQTLPVKKDQVYVGGLSMGGMGTFDIVNRMPGVFAAAFPICGAANSAIAGHINNTSWWIFHGKKDPLVPFHFSEDMATALQKAKAEVKFTAYPEAKHNSWDKAFAEPGLFDWLFTQKRGD